MPYKLKQPLGICLLCREVYNKHSWNAKLCPLCRPANDRLNSKLCKRKWVAKERQKGTYGKKPKAHGGLLSKVRIPECDIDIAKRKNIPTVQTPGRSVCIMVNCELQDLDKNTLICEQCEARRKWLGTF